MDLNRIIRVHLLTFVFGGDNIFMDRGHGMLALGSPILGFQPEEMEV
jgi:hypothetical protein